MPSGTSRSSTGIAVVRARPGGIVGSDSPLKRAMESERPAAASPADAASEPGASQSGERRDERDRCLIAMLDAEFPGKAATSDFQRAEQQHDAQGEFGVLGQSGEERNVWLDERVDQAGKQAVLRPGAGVDEGLEVTNEVGIGELVEAGEGEIDAEGGRG